MTITYSPSTAGDIRVSLPLSKSMAARALIIAALQGKGPDNFAALPDADDTRELAGAIRELLANAGERELHINIGLGGTSLRFFLALAASTPGLKTILECRPELARRPLKPLCEALAAAGAKLNFPLFPDRPPIEIEGCRMGGGEIEMPGNVSSQFASALMMCAPYWKNGLRLRLSGTTAVSFPYIMMTAGMMRAAGAEISVSGKKITVAPKPYSSLNPLAIEPDWSAASYFYEMTLLLPGIDVIIRKLTPAALSLQGDSRCAEIFNRLGVETDFREDGSALLRCDEKKRRRLAEKEEVVNIDITDVPDLAPAIAAGCALAGIRFRLTGAAHLRHKESDRVAALQSQLNKLGYILDSDEQSISWTGIRCPAQSNPVVDTHGDHRIAMSFAIAACARSAITLSEPRVVGKSFPHFFDELKDAGYTMTSVEKNGATV